MGKGKHYMHSMLLYRLKQC